MKPGKISSLREIQLQVPRILENYADDQELAFIALANPLAALEKIGYTFSAAARLEIEDRIRFGKQDAEKISKIRESIYSAAGSKFNLDSPAELKKHFKTILSKPIPVVGKGKPTTKKISGTKMNSILKIVGQPAEKAANEVLDPLGSYRKDHPAIGALVEYRKIDASQARLADKETITTLLANRDTVPLKNITFRLNRKIKS